MRDEHNHLVQMNGMNGPVLVGACGRGIPIAMVPVVPVGAVNGNEPNPAMQSVSNLGNGSRDCKYDDKNRIYSVQNYQNKTLNRKLPSNGAPRMPLRPLFNSKNQPGVRNPNAQLSASAISSTHPFRPQSCLAPYMSRYSAPLPAPPPYGSYPVPSSTSSFLKSRKPAAYAFPSWWFNAELKMKCMLCCNCRLTSCKLKNTKTLCCIATILLTTDGEMKCLRIGMCTLAAVYPTITIQIVVNKILELPLSFHM